jgi:hypothetical protein
MPEPIPLEAPVTMATRFLVIVAANHSLVRFHGQSTKGHYWYNYLYSDQELRPWVEKVDQIIFGISFNLSATIKPASLHVGLKDRNQSSTTKRELFK